jgi:hypothetical protein
MYPHSHREGNLGGAVPFRQPKLAIHGTPNGGRGVGESKEQAVAGGMEQQPTRTTKRLSEHAVMLLDKRYVSITEPG